MANTTEVTLPVSGRTVTIRRPPISSSSLVMDFQVKHPKPRPPMQEVKLMGKVEWVENIAHPDYPRALNEWHAALSVVVTSAMLNFGIVSQPDDDDMVQIDQTRAMLGDLLSEATDQEVFIRYILTNGEEDFEALSEAIGALTRPTEAQITQNTERFRRAV